MLYISYLNILFVASHTLLILLQAQFLCPQAREQNILLRYDVHQAMTINGFSYCAAD